MKIRHLERAAREAIVLAAVLERRLPPGREIPAEELFSAVWPLACRLTRLERRAKRDKKAAAAYRALRDECDEMIRTRPDAPCPLPDLLATTELRADSWHTALVPGAALAALEGEAA
jgi:hypothetical protein